MGNLILFLKICLARNGGSYLRNHPGKSGYGLTNISDLTYTLMNEHFEYKHYAIKTIL